MAVQTDNAGRSIDSAGALALLNDTRYRGIIAQIALIIALVAFGWWLVHNTVENLRSANIASGFDFLERRSGFEISQLPITFSSDATYGRAILVGILNTLIVSAAGILVATILGFLVGIGRLSTNYIIRGLSTIYVETFRNIPPLLVIMFWYFGVLAVLPRPNQAITLPFGSFLSNRGLQTPVAQFQAGAWLTGLSLIVGIGAAALLIWYSRKRQMATGYRLPTLWPSLGLIIGLPIIVFVLSGLPVEFEYPTATRFNLQGGFQIKPEFLALLVALSVYTSAFIAEIVRAGILSVSHGQTEAASALGLRRGKILRHVIVPQAFRVIIPPLTSQYLNLTKNSSLGLAVGYPDLVAVGSTVLNQTGQSVEVVAIWMAVYLTISLVVSMFMNWFNRRVKLVER
ncbi:amino acid ABC transporter permease [Notoacmeibacter ruber]|uniref:Amino acid ABC transporter permease n=1 Tax=Notoacmeibacter ruber TaxID=2670375 RepID=A0A3L7JAT4_9HYPH|nr:amino acid ABC transporter permease [Notoacmeibacter ruber]RLQ87554.1 amino acid ABC transporter permease [Notoacmeibacter ruber]